MRYHYCPKCGAKLSLRQLGDDGEVPWCASCETPWFDTFSTCVIALVTDGEGQVALLRQAYISKRYANLVSGYMQPGETAEEAAAREIGEELGLETTELRFVSTYWFEKKDMLMVGFIARVDKRDFRLSQEVDQAVWVSPEQALDMVHPGRAISRQVLEEYLRRRDQGGISSKE